MTPTPSFSRGRARLRRALTLPVILHSAFCILHSSYAQPASILPHGDFEQADPRDAARPAGWDRVDGLGVQWTNAPDAAHGKAIRMDTRISEQAMQAQWVKMGLTNLWNIPKPDKNPIAETYGLSLYSDAIPVKPRPGLSHHL
jgi:hypothetical protein